MTLPDFLLGIAQLLVLGGLIAGAYLLYRQALKTGPEQTPEPSADPEALTRSLSQTVAAIQRHGDKSDELVAGAETQTQALVEVVKNLQRRATALAQTAQTLSVALEALSSGDHAQIARAAGAVKDRHIAGLMTMASADVDETYWHNVALLISHQLGSTQRWQQDYSQMAAQLMTEVSGIKTNLLAAEANLQAADAAQPLLTARVNLEQAARLLRTPITETPEILAAPRYQLEQGVVQ